MNIENIKTNELLPYSMNAKKHPEKQIETLARSIEKVGFRVPILIDQNNVVIAGHCRLLAAERLGLETVPCIRNDDLTPEMTKILRLADNKISEMGNWDTEELMRELETIPEIDMNLIGFSKDELKFFKKMENLDCYFSETRIVQGKKLIKCPHCGKEFEK